MPTLASDLERFWAKVEKTETCWLWTDSLMNGGYGAFSSNITRPNKSAHVFAYIVFVGPVPDGMELDHSCHVEHCVNPEHLRPVIKLVNQHNRKGPNRNGSTGYRGVYLTKRRGAYPGTYHITIQMDGKIYEKYGFTTAEDAHIYAEQWREILLTAALKLREAAPQTRPRVSGNLHRA